MKKCMIVSIALAALVASPKDVAAQTDPCATPIPATVTTTLTTFPFKVCVPTQQPDGSATTVTGIAVIVDGVRTNLTTLTPGPATPSGYLPYTVTLTGLTRANHSVNSLYFNTKGDSPTGNPFVLGVEEVRPTLAPRNAQ